MVMKLLLQVRDLRAGLAALACKALVNGIDGNIDEPRTGDTNQSQFHIDNQKRRRNRPNVSNPKIENEYRKTEKKVTENQNQNKTEQNRNGMSLHLANTLINSCLRWQLGQLLRCQLQHTDIALLGCHVGLGDSDLLLRGDGAGFNLREELLRD
jgi:hypothetical protein